MKNSWYSKEENCQKMLLKCFRNGVYKSIATQRHVKLRGSHKINAFCPSQIQVKTFSSGKVSIVFDKTHVGHENEIGRLRLSNDIKREVASKLILKIGHKEILKSTRVPTSSSNDSKKLQRSMIITKQDIRNISKAYNTNGEINRHPIDSISVKSWVEEMQKNGDTILYYKPVDEICDKYPNLKKDEFVLIIMTKVQEEIMRKYAKNHTCIDSPIGQTKS